MCVAGAVEEMLRKLVFEQKPCEEPNTLTSPFPEPVGHRCCAGFEVGPASLTWPVGNAWQLPGSPQPVFKIALSVLGSRAQLPRSLWVSGQQRGSDAWVGSSSPHSCHQGGAVGRRSGKPSVRVL